ncbi:hypothetical protein G6514_004169 [Epicoccum nigrum]|nr:hypothetical protein G6514_004169 [Epicoccum nigrum]
MVSHTASTSTTGDRRKKAITYGKLSRLPPPRPNLLHDDAPSPERPHKHAVTSPVSLARPRAEEKFAQYSANARATATGLDVFDVPSEDEFDFPPTTPAKRPTAQQRKTDGDPRAGVTIQHNNLPSRPALPATNPLQKPAVAKASASRAKPFQERARGQQAARETATQSALSSSFTEGRGKPSQAVEGQKLAATDKQRLQGSNTSSKQTSRTTTLTLPTQAVSKARPTNAVFAAHSSKPARSIAKPSASMDEFDVPSDNEDTSVPISKAPNQRPRQPIKSTVKESGIVRIPSVDKSRKAPVKSNEVGGSQNRKRKGSVHLEATVKPVVEGRQDTSNIERERKVAKRKEGASPGHEPPRTTTARSTLSASTGEPMINKPKRTRMRTVPYTKQPAMAKGQSSPAVLHKMLPVEQPGRSSYKETVAEVPASDDTMYDIPDAITTPVRPSLRRNGSSTPGSVTPRQRGLFSTLLEGTAAPKTPASAIASLQLSEKKPRSLLGALARSKSDISHSKQSRKARLIDTLKVEESSSEEDDSESDSEADNTLTAEYEVDADRTPVQAKHTFITKKVDDDVEIKTTAAESQASQASQTVPMAPSRPKLTYASQRSYLQEENPEDEFLMSMDLDDNWRMDPQAVSTDDEDGPTSQPRTHHELRKHGQNTMFSWDMEESIREISSLSNRSGRRSAMIELCTKMVDAGFVSQLLDSGFMHKLLEHMLSPGDTIFDFIAAAAILFVLQTKPAFAVVDQIQCSGVTKMLMTLADKDTDISKIARDRKSNMSKIAQESVSEFCALVLESQVWTSGVPEKMSPQLLALETIDMLTRSHRESGSTDALLTPGDVSKVVNVCSITSKRVESSKSSVKDKLVIDLAISILETVSVADQDYSMWPTRVVQQLSDTLPIFFEIDALSKTMEAMKLCMHITNNKPKACQPFSTPAFIKSLVRFIVARFAHLDASDPDRSQVLAELTLALGAMINLAELSDQARLHAVNDADAIKTLVKTFQVGAERTAEATSVEESSVSVVIGFLAVLLGMLCLNSTARSQVQCLFPDERLGPLFDIMQQMARLNEHVDKKTAKRFPEGRNTLNNYYTRIMHVVKKLESAAA